MQSQPVSGDLRQRAAEGVAGDGDIRNPALVQVHVLGALNSKPGERQRIIGLVIHSGLNTIPASASSPSFTSSRSNSVPRWATTSSPELAFRYRVPW